MLDSIYNAKPLLHRYLFFVGFDNDVTLSKGLFFKGLGMLGKALLCIRKNRPYFSHHLEEKDLRQF